MIKKILANKIVKGILKLIEIAFFILAALYVAFIIFQRVTNNSSFKGYRVFTIASESMLPVYKIGDIILVKETSGELLKVGDDITYMGKKGDFKDMIITHRIIEKKDNTITTKGLANEISDDPINYDQVFGKVESKLLVVSLISRILNRKAGFYFLVFIPLMLIIFIEFSEMFLDPEKIANE